MPSTRLRCKIIAIARYYQLGSYLCFHPELKTGCSSSTSIDVTLVLSPSLFHVLCSYMRCAIVAAAQSPLSVKTSSTVCISPNHGERNPHEDLSMATAIHGK